MRQQRRTISNCWSFRVWQVNTVQHGLKRMYAHHDQYGFPGGNAVVLRAIVGREPHTLRQYVQELANRKLRSPRSAPVCVHRSGTGA